MTVQEILSFREKRYAEEESMWIELLNEKYPIGKIVKIDGIDMKVVGYGIQQSIPVVKFERLIQQQTSKFYFDLPEFKDGGVS